MIKTEIFATGLLSTNTYIVSDKNTAIIIDPAGNSDALIKHLEGLNPAAVLLTHGHFDHIGGAEAISTHFDIPVYICEKDEEMLTDSIKNGSFPLLYRHITVNSPMVRLIDGDSELFIRDMHIKALHTPGHTRGSLSYLIEGSLFSGDLVFYGGSYGRTDLHGGDMKALINSIRSLKALPETTLVYTGHGETGFSLGEYFKHSPF